MINAVGNYQLLKTNGYQWLSMVVPSKARYHGRDNKEEQGPLPWEIQPAFGKSGMLVLDARHGQANESLGYRDMGDQFHAWEAGGSRCYSADFSSALNPLAVLNRCLWF